MMNNRIEPTTATNTKINVSAHAQINHSRVRASDEEVDQSMLHFLRVLTGQAGRRKINRRTPFV